MAYNENLADRVRERFADLHNVEEMPMMGGLVFMYNDKMCVGVRDTELMCRIDPEERETLVEKPGCRSMVLGGRLMKSYVFIDDTYLQSKKDLDYWINLALAFNPKAKSSKKKK